MLFDLHIIIIFFPHVRVVIFGFFCNLEFARQLCFFVLELVTSPSCFLSSSRSALPFLWERQFRVLCFFYDTVLVNVNFRVALPFTTVFVRSKWSSLWTLLLYCIYTIKNWKSSICPPSSSLLPDFWSLLLCCIFYSYYVFTCWAVFFVELLRATTSPAAAKKPSLSSCLLLSKPPFCVNVRKMCGNIFVSCVSVSAVPSSNPTAVCCQQMGVVSFLLPAALFHIFICIYLCSF